MPYEYRPTDVMDFAHTFSTEKKQKGKELFFKECPYCKGGGHDKWTFSINLESGLYKCFRSSCGKQGHFVELARDFQFKLDYGEQKHYRRLPQRELRVLPKAIEYMGQRGISQKTVERYRVTTQSGNENILVFPFYDENNELIFIKYRNTKYSGHGNKEWCEKGTKPILFGMAQCMGHNRLIITEGQIDSLSIAECGIDNAVSVPTGALGFTWLQNVWDWITRFEEIVVFGDNENGKMTLLPELQKRVPARIKAVQIPDYLGEKDANDILRKYGKQALIHAIENAVVPPMKNVKELADVRRVDLNKLPKIKTNIQEIDKMINGMIFGQVVVLTGKRGNGKSTFMSQLIVEALEQDYPVFVYSGELNDYHFKRWIDFQAAGPRHIDKNINEYGDEIYNIPDDVVKKINDWYRGKAYIYDNSFIPASKEEFEKLTDTIIKTIQQFGVKLICIDNLMTAMDVGMDQNLYQAQSKFVEELKNIAMTYEVVVILVAHPRKSREGFTNDDIAGSGDITNRVDIIFSYERDEKDDSCDSKLAITKNRLEGKLTSKGSEIPLFYSNSTKRITSLSSKHRIYGWEKNYDAHEADYDVLPFGE